MDITFKSLQVTDSIQQLFIYAQKITTSDAFSWDFESFRHFRASGDGHREACEWPSQASFQRSARIGEASREVIRDREIRKKKEKSRKKSSDSSSPCLFVLQEVERSRGGVGEIEFAR